MVKNIYLNIDDDVKKAIRKIKLEKAVDITIILPKQALLFSEFSDLHDFKEQLDLLGKHVSFLTNDVTGQHRAKEAGFDLISFDSSRKVGGSMDFKRKVKSAAKTESLSAVSSVAQKPEPPSAKTLTPRPIPRPVRLVTEAHHDFLTGPSDTTLLRTRPEPKARLPRKPRRYFRIFQILVLAAILIIILLVTVILPQANVIVFARSQPIVRDFTLTIDRNATAANVQQFVLPGQIYDSPVSHSQEFQASGQLNVGVQAHGAVQMYNFTRQTFKLGSGTTVLTVGKKTYHLVNDIIGLRPTAYISGTKDPDAKTLSPQVQIVADTPGEDSNLPGGTLFEVHNQVLGSLPQVLYAKNTDPVTGGTSRFRTYVTQQDIDTARKALQSEALRDIRQQLENSKGMTILDSGANMQVSSITFDKNANDQALNFTGNLTGHITALAFSTAALKSLVEQRISLTLDPDKYLVTDKKERITEDFRNVDLNLGTGALVVHFESLVSSKIDTKGIASKINGKTALEIKEMLLSDNNIDGVDITFKPFWVNSVPKFSGKVYVVSQ